MNIKCPRCGKTMTLDAEIAEGQNIRCPYCDEKFAYHAEAETVKVERRQQEPQQVFIPVVATKQKSNVWWRGFKVLIAAVLWIAWFAHFVKNFDYSFDSGNTIHLIAKKLVSIECILYFIAAFLFSHFCVEETPQD